MDNPFQKIMQNMKRPGDLQRSEPIKQPGETNGVAYRTETYTYFTLPDGETHLLYSAEQWVNIKLTLETAGPVAVSTRDSVSPVLSGKGILLVTGRDVEFILPKGSRLFVAATAINRVSYVTEPTPWLQTISQSIVNVKDAILNNTKTIVAIASGRRPTKRIESPKINNRLKPPRF